MQGATFVSLEPITNCLQKPASKNKKVNHEHGNICYNSMAYTGVSKCYTTHFSVSTPSLVSIPFHDALGPVLPREMGLIMYQLSGIDPCHDAVGQPHPFVNRRTTILKTLPSHNRVMRALTMLTAICIESPNQQLLARFLIPTHLFVLWN